MIKYWIKILRTNQDALLYKIYTMLKEDANNGTIHMQCNWAYHIKKNSCTVRTCIHVEYSKFGRNKFQHNQTTHNRHTNKIGNHQLITQGN